MRKNILRSSALLAAITAMMPSPAKAEMWGSAGGWDIISGDGKCVMFQQFEGAGETELSVAIYTNGDAGMIVQNSQWSAMADQKYDIVYWIDGSIFEGHPSTGYKKSGDKPGFMAAFESTFADSFASGKTLTIKMGDVIVDQLSLNGTGVAVAKTRQCVRSVAATEKMEEKERQRLGHIAQDPFQAATMKLASNQPPIPVGDRGAWASSNDYPSMALRENREGTVEYALTVGTDGRVSKCEITVSSGHADLDNAACTHTTRRARFISASDGNGKPVEGQFSQATRWQIPK